MLAPIRQLPSAEVDPEAPPIVFVIDDEKGIRDHLENLFVEAGWNPIPFESAEEFLSSYAGIRRGPQCLIVDIRLPGVSGLSLLEQIGRDEQSPPALVLTAYPETDSLLRAFRARAFDVFPKPVNDQLLLDRVRAALEHDLRRQMQRRRVSEITRLMDLLTDRERQVMNLVVAGHKNMVIASKLGLSHRTVEIHRRAVMQKTRSRSLPDLVRKYLEVYGNQHTELTDGPPEPESEGEA